MTDYEVTNVTGGGYKKFEPVDGDGKPKFQNAKGQWTKPNAYNASAGHDKITNVTNRKTGEFVTRRSKEDVLTVEGEVKAYKDGHRFMVEVESVDEADKLLGKYRSKWGAFQLHGRFEYTVTGGDSVERGIVTGSSRVKDSLEEQTFPVPVTRVDEDGAERLSHWEDVSGTMPEKAYREAEEHAWSKLTASVVGFHLETLYVIFYVDSDSSWSQAAEYSHVPFEGQLE